MYNNLLKGKTSIAHLPGREDKDESSINPGVSLRILI